MIVIDGTNQKLGRLSTYVAKKLLLGEQVVIVNAEKVVIIGKPTTVFQHYDQKFKRGHVVKGPFFPKRADLILKRTIRGMLPFKTTRGREAYERVRCYVGVPEEFKDSKMVQVPGADYHYNEVAVTLLDVSKYLGYHYKNV